MVSTEFPSTTVSRFVQSSKASVPIDVTEFPMMTDYRFVHSQNALVSIRVIEFPIVTDSSPKHPSNAYSPIVPAAVSGMTMELSCVPQS